MLDYNALRESADTLIAQLGQAVNIRRNVKSGGTDYEPTYTPTDYPTSGTVTALPRWYPAFADNSDVLRTDRLATIAAGPLGAIVPTAFDLLVLADGATIYRIIDSKPVAPAGIPVAYTLQLRI